MVTVLAERQPATAECIDLETDAGWEFADGQLRERNVSFDSSETGGAFLGAWYLSGVAPRTARVAGSDLGLRLWPEEPLRTRRADAVLILRSRLPAGPHPYLGVAPDIVVEAASANDTFREVRLKVDEWLNAGVKVVWVALPESREVHVYRLDAPPAILGPGDNLEVPDILPGFRVPVADLFPAYASDAVAEA